ncbi:MAG: hypothetical protein ACYCYE_11415 [Clostridia bacterium]
MNTDITSTPVQRERAGTPEATLASRILLLASLIVNTIKQDNMLVLASIMNLIALLLIRRAAVLEAEEQQIAPGVTTFANNLKLIATPLSITASVLLLWSLLIEVSLKQPIVGVSPAPTAAGSAGAFLV